MRKLICWLTGHKWLKPYHKTDYPEFICQRCGEYGSTGVKPPKGWPRMPETKAPRQYIVGRAPERPDRAPVTEWLDPLIFPPPRGMKIQLLTDWEIAVYGHWSDTGYVAWAPLMQKPAWLAQRLRDKALARRGKVDVSAATAGPCVGNDHGNLRRAQGPQGDAHQIDREGKRYGS